MATTRKTRTTKSTSRAATGAAVGQNMGEGAVRDLVGQMLREAFGTHSRELEQHLNDINRRLSALENETRR